MTQILHITAYIWHHNHHVDVLRLLRHLFR